MFLDRVFQARRGPEERRRNSSTVLPARRDCQHQPESATLRDAQHNPDFSFFMEVYVSIVRMTVTSIALMALVSTAVTFAQAPAPAQGGRGGRGGGRPAPATLVLKV